MLQDICQVIKVLEKIFPSEDQSFKKQENQDLAFRWACFLLEMVRRSYSIYSEKAYSVKLGVVDENSQISLTANLNCGLDKEISEKQIVKSIYWSYVECNIEQYDKQTRGAVILLKEKLYNMQYEVVDVLRR